MIECDWKQHSFWDKNDFGLNTLGCLRFSEIPTLSTTKLFSGLKKRKKKNDLSKIFTVSMIRGMVLGNRTKDQELSPNIFLISVSNWELVNCFSKYCWHIRMYSALYIKDIWWSMDIHDKKI